MSVSMEILDGDALTCRETEPGFPQAMISGLQMVKNNILRISASHAFGWAACAVISTGLVVQAPQPAAADWLKDLFETPSRNTKARVKKKRRQEQLRRQRKKQQAQTKRKVKKVLAQSAPANSAPLVDENEPVQIVISLSQQRMTVYKGGIQIETSKVSSGKAGHTTPSGIFSILQKNRYHYSNIYNNAPMPFMQRLTWSGVALHAGRVPNYPASHGCIRLPHSFAGKLFGITDRGGQVIVTRGEVKVEEIKHAKLFQPAVLATIFDPKYLTAATRGTNQSAEAASEADEANAAPLFQGTQKRLVATVDTAADTAEPLLNAETAVAKIRREKVHTYEGRDDRPVRILITRRTKRERIIDIQAMLNTLGYENGTPDGKLGRLTRIGIKKFQKLKGLPVTGTESEELWRQLNSATGIWRYSTGHLYVRQGFKDVFDEPVTINHPNKPLGTHVYMALNFKAEATSTRWTAATLKQTRPPRSSDHINDQETLAKANAVTALQALERVEISDRLRRRIEAMLTPGSSLIISDNGIDTRETTPQGTDFIVRTW